MDTQALNYELPTDRIATTAAEPRDSAKLLVARRDSGRVEDRTVRELGDANGLLRPGDLMVFNITRVLPARFEATRRGTGGRVKGLYLGSAMPQTAGPGGDSTRRAAAEWRVMLESRGTLQAGELLDLENDASLELIESHGDGQWRAQVNSGLDTPTLLDRIGDTPLPPYIRQARKVRGEPEIRPEDALRYNTVFAHDPGSVAAPTAALHFTPELLRQIDALGVRRATLTLHVGLGTFAPVRTTTLESHAMHAEWISIPARTIAALHQTRQSGGRIIPVGTTCVRALESLPDPLPTTGDDYAANTNLFIKPPFSFRFADALMTNFHLPRSTLLALVAALPHVGLDRLMQWYSHAIEREYRFYSYGDAMLIL